MLVYLDDIPIFAKSEKEHIQHLKQILQVLRENQFYAKMAKCHFMKEELHYLGHIIGKNSTKVDSRNTEIVTKWHRPLEIGQLQSFSRLCNTSAYPSMDIML